MSEEKLNTTTIARPWFVFLMMNLGWLFMMFVLGANTTAFPFLTAALGINSSYVTWMSAAYTLGAAVLAPLMGRLGDLVGIKKIFSLGLFLFILSVLGLGSATNFAIVLISRLIQGLSVACVVPSCIAFGGRFFKGGEAAKAYTIFGAISTAGNIVGPMAAGVLCSSGGFRWVYYGGAVLNLIVLIICLIVIPKIPVIPVKHGKFDLGGCITLFIAVASLLILPTIGQQKGWQSPLAITCIILFIVFIIAFVLIEKKVSEPFMRLELFKSKTFTIPAIFTLMINGIVTVFMYLVSYYVIGGLQMSSKLSGTWTTVTMVFMTVGAIGVGKLMTKVNWKCLSFIHVIIYVISCLIFVFVDVNPVVMLFIGGAVLGLAGSFNTPLPSASGLADVPDAERGVASGTFRLFNDFTGPIMTAIYVPLLSSIGITAEGYPNFAAAFPKVSMLVLIPAAIGLILCFFYPNHDPKADK